MTTDNDKLSEGTARQEGGPGEHTAPNADDAQAAAARAAAEQAAIQAAAEQAKATAQAAIAALDAALAARVTAPAGDDSKQYKDKWPDYLLQWRSSLWVSMREKESNVWKFVAFYATAITLIIGLGQRTTTAAAASGVDLPVDVSGVAVVIGLLTFWGLAIIIDSNFWMSRNLKFVGNIEKLFLPEDEYGRLIPGYYSSPLFRYARPYSINFFFLVVLGCIAYLNFAVSFPLGGAAWRPYLLPGMTLIYLGGFHAVQVMDASARKEYFRFYKEARGKEIAIGSEKMPPEHLEFKTAAAARFQKWALAGGIVIVLCYTLRELLTSRERWLWWPVALLILISLFHLVMSWRLTKRLREIEDKQGGRRVGWPELRVQTLTNRRQYEQAKNFWMTASTVVRWVVLAVAVLTVAISVCPWLRDIAVGR